jgi:hypothetical protein
MTTDEFIEIGMRNSYRIMSGESTLDDILEEYSKQSGSQDDFNDPIFFIEPDEICDDEDIDTMIKFYEDREEYEKCTVLLKFRDKYYEGI